MLKICKKSVPKQRFLRPNSHFFDSNFPDQRKIGAEFEFQLQLGQRN